MIGELFLAGITIVVPANESLERTQNYKMHPFAQYSSMGSNNFLNNELYFAGQGNTYALMTPNSSTHYNFPNNKAKKALVRFKSILQDLIIDFDERYDYFNYLAALRNEESYDDFLRLSAVDKNVKVCNAISIFLSQKDYKFILAEEEIFILNMLKSNNLQIQEFALSALLNWDNVSDVEVLKTIKIKNRYLQEDLNLFIEQKV